MAKVLSEQRFDVWLVVDHENKIHVYPPESATAATRGSTIRNSVNSPDRKLFSLRPPR